MQYGLIGKTLAHSFSAGYFANKFKQAHIDASYQNFELDRIDLLPRLVAKFPLLKGLNVTIPYKQAVIPFLDALSPEAADIGAVNTIAFSSSGELIGHNTDVVGFRESLDKALQGRPVEQAVVLGTGGAAQAVTYVLKEKLGVKRPLMVSRSPRSGQIGYPDLKMLQAGDFDVVINTSPLGTFPNIHEAPDFPYHILDERHLAYDLVYNPPETLFLKKASSQAASTENGYAMLVSQAEASWNIWQQAIAPGYSSSPLNL